jgi:hypothetical protein
MAVRSGKIRMRRVALSDVKDDLSKYLRLAEEERIVITRHGKPAGVLDSDLRKTGSTTGSRPIPVSWAGLRRHAPI